MWGEAVGSSSPWSGGFQATSVASSVDQCFVGLVMRTGVSFSRSNSLPHCSSSATAVIKCSSYMETDGFSRNTWWFVSSNNMGKTENHDVVSQSAPRPRGETWVRVCASDIPWSTVPRTGSVIDSPRVWNTRHPARCLAKTVNSNPHS